MDTYAVHVYDIGGPDDHGGVLDPTSTTEYDDRWEALTAAEKVLAERPDWAVKVVEMHATTIFYAGADVDEPWPGFRTPSMQ